MSARRGVVLVLSLILLAVTVSAVGMFAIAAFSGTTPTVPASSTLSLRVERAVFGN